MNASPPAAAVERLLPTDEARDLLALTADIAAGELRPRVDAAEDHAQFPRDLFRLLGRSGLLSLPYPQDVGGGAQPYEVYLQVVEELARSWLAVGMGVSVHVLSCFPLAAAGSVAQQRRWLPDMLGGDTLGAYCLSEPESGSDAAALRTAAVPTGEHYTVTGVKAWITHAGHADFYTLMVRTGGDGPAGISCLLAAADTPGLRSAAPERKMGVRSSATAQVILDGARIGTDRLIGGEGRGFRIAMAALDAGRLGIAACAVGLAQAALDLAVAYAGQRQQFGRPIGAFQGIGFLLADMAAAVAAARSLYLDAARRKDAGLRFGTQAAMAKLVATDTAMRVATDTVQVLGGAGYTQDFPAERYFREAKLLQIVEGTNQIQRLVISRDLLR
jgi:alkylation response protein AidB-like acyl-CoA dehydrogenase